MDTLRRFVAALLPETTQRVESGSSKCRELPDHQKYYSKPDTLSRSYELRRLKLRRVYVGKDAPENVNVDWPETDFYEYYWAHHMYGTTVSHLVNWLARTLVRGRHVIKTPITGFARLRRLAVCAWAITIAIGAVIFVGAWALASLHGAWLLLGQLGAVIGGLGALVYLLDKALAYVGIEFLRLVLDVIGDVARYLDVNPQNVARRYDILRGGIDLLRKLHEARDQRGDEVMYRYGRVIVVGHSLGSVIAYDILRHYWAEVNGRISATHMHLRRVERFYPRGSPPPKPCFATLRSRKDFRRAQGRAWRTLGERVPSGRALKERTLWREASGRATKECPLEPADGWKPARWLVSDLITLGSPLSYAPVLLADGQLEGSDGLCNKIRLRELPTCPPDRSRHLRPGRFTVDLAAEDDRFDDYRILHHAAHFALTRWTNFWYPRDFIGGPLGPSFGLGIRDIRLKNVSMVPTRAHTRYWTDPEGECVKALRAILKPSPKHPDDE